MIIYQFTIYIIFINHYVTRVLKPSINSTTHVSIKLLTGSLLNQKLLQL